MPAKDYIGSGPAYYSTLVFAVLDWQLSPTKRTEKTRLEYVGLTAPCPSATGQERPFTAINKNPA